MAPEKITQIRIDYRRQRTRTPKETTETGSDARSLPDYTEQLIIDRASDTIEYIERIDTGCTISHKYEIEGGVQVFLDYFDAGCLFGQIRGAPEDAIEFPSGPRDYRITLRFESGPEKVITGSFDKDNLPEDYSDFARITAYFLHSYSRNEILSPYMYERQRRRKSDLIFCSVEFENSYKSYYYLTEDDTIEIGDAVIVPAGWEDRRAIAEVVDIEYCSKEDAPFPLEKTKHILRKCTAADFNPPWEPES